MADLDRVLPRDLVLLEDVVARLPSQSIRNLRAMARRRTFPDILPVGGKHYVRGPELELWLAGRWETAKADRAAVVLSVIAPPPNRRAKRAGV